MSHLAEQLRNARETRRISTDEHQWKATRAIIDDVFTKTQHPPCPDGAGAAGSCDFVMSEGSDPVFRYDPDEAVRRLAPGTPEDAWHADADDIIARIERITKLDVTWDTEAKVLILAEPKAAPAMMFAEMRTNIEQHGQPKGIPPRCRCAKRTPKPCAHRRGPRGDNVSPQSLGFPPFAFQPNAAPNLGALGKAVFGAKAFQADDVQVNKFFAPAGVMGVPDNNGTPPQGAGAPQNMDPALEAQGAANGVKTDDGFVQVAGQDDAAKKAAAQKAAAKKDKDGKDKKKSAGGTMPDSSP